MMFPHNYYLMSISYNLVIQLITCEKISLGENLIVFFW